DPADHHDTLPEALRQTFSDEDLVVIDPVDPERNVASVLSNENYARFVYDAWRFLQEPGTDFFFPERTVPDEEEIAAAARDRGDLLVVDFPVPDLLDDILHPQMRRLHRRLRQVLTDAEFRVFDSGFHVGERARFLFDLYSAELPAVRRHHGPQVFHDTEHVRNFTGAHDHVWVEEDRLVTIVDRDVRTADTLVREFLGGDLQAAGVPGQLVPAVEQAEVVTELPLDGDDWRMFLRDEFNLDVER
ncbi:MAG: hypothetical protein ABEK12_03455, partial [Candidatus Nanohaloarchaea archaeon]